ncbi:unnamed protein product (macronuclear) [Paramecium tetraurelia]|uniref:Nucleoporin Nup133/Nup155-like N-terminal domain-containing protein n=1 Tax=Paramecium tetraurelia TaxID=5888 RepID=A0BX16_PARTE|nr:uncharacterized protein GSPATT00032935001 [Paramecium tetraurelia]CAK63083.1 unnamed protein product [Paramecium tetraurelia]|eukprot:XP_001430481.1 hypothetical protein (macronuclear) [Paramecium tetraurelia strain d4-2]
MFEEIQLSGIVAKEIASYSNITLMGNQVEEHFKCTDQSITQLIEEIIYVVKVTNGQTVSIHKYDMKDLFNKSIQLSSEYFNFSHLITQNGCVIMRDQDTPYLFVVTQTGQIFYKNLISYESRIINNLMVDNQRLMCLAKPLIYNDQIKFYVLSDTDFLNFITIDVRRGEIAKSKYQLSFGTKFLSKFFGNQTNDWRTAFQISEKQIIHYSFQTQFHLLEIKGSDITCRHLQIEDNIKVKQIEVFQHKPNGQITLCYLQQNQLKIYSLIGNSLRINCVISQLDFLLNITFNISSIQNSIILIQGCEIYQLNNENPSFQLVNQNKYPVLGYINQDDQLLLFYKNHISFINQVQNQFSRIQYQLRQEIYKFKKDVENQKKLKDEELILQSISIEVYIKNKFDQFQTLLKFMHRSLDQKKVIQLMKRQYNNFCIEDFMNQLLEELEDLYYYLKPTIQMLELNFHKIYNQLREQLSRLDHFLMHLYSNQFYPQQDSIQDQSVKLSLLKSLVINQLKDYYYMYLEIYLGLAVIVNISNIQFDLKHNHQLFYATMLLLTLFQEKSYISFQNLVKKQFQIVSRDISLQNLTAIQNVVDRFINIISGEVFRDFAIPEELLCENFQQNQQKSLINKNNAKELIRYYQVSQCIGYQQHNILEFINENEDQYQELKLRISFYLQQQHSLQNQDEQEIILKNLIGYAIKQEEHQLLFQILNLNETKKITNQLVEMIDSYHLYKCQLTARTTDQIAELLLQYSREKCRNLMNAEKVLQYFSFLMRQESKDKALTLLFEYIVNLEMLLFTLKSRKVSRAVKIQLDYIKLLLSQMQLSSKQDQYPYCQQLVCKLSNQNYEQFKNPSIINDKSEIDQKSPENIKIVNLEQIIKFKKYKEIQNFVCLNYIPYAQLNKVVEQLILNGHLK